MALAFVVVVILVAVGSWLIYPGHDWAGSAIIAIDKVGLAAVFITGGIRLRQDSVSPENADDLMRD